MSTPTLVIVDRRGPSVSVPSAATTDPIAPAAAIALTSLDRIRIRLAFEHDRHSTGPVFPCPLCFRRAL